MIKISIATLFAVIAMQAEAKEWSFDVFLDKQKMGTHRFVLNDGRLKSEANFNVKILFINAYIYTHVAEEAWQNDCLSTLKSHTIENKAVFNVQAKQVNKKFEVDYNGKTQSLPECVMTFAYWNPAILKQSQLLNPQNAEYLDTTIQRVGEETIAVKGVDTVTTHYTIKGALDGKNKLNIDIWYNQNQDWVALKSTTPEGYNVYYKLK